MTIENKIKIFATVGMFDGVHLGHRYVLSRLKEEACKHGAYTLAFTFDRHPLEIVSPDRVPAILCTVERRVQLIEESGIDKCHVLHFDEKLRHLTAREFIAKLKKEYGVETLIMGYDHGFGSDRLSTIEEFREAAKPVGVEIVRCDCFTIDTAEGNKTVSSSSIRKAIEGGNLDIATVMLGRDYSIEGKIIEGRHLGRTIGFPTANIEVLDVLIPQNAVYAARAIYNGNAYAAMVNIGKNPTISKDNTQSIEAHLINFEGDIYGQNICLEFIKLLRHERYFDSLEALSQQLCKDRQEVEKLVNI